MSDELTPGRRHADENADDGSNRSQLAVALHELAQNHETPVAVPGAEIRRRAVRRRRRRKASLAAVGTAGVGALALVLAVALTGGEDPRSVPPAASYGVDTPPATARPSPVPVAATVDLARRELTAEGRTLPLSAGTAKSPTPTGLMTVTAKFESTTVPGAVAGWSTYDVKATWVMRLRGPDDRTNYLLALSWDEKAPGNYDTTGGAIGLRSEDAMWLYEALSPGAVVRVVGRPATEPPVGAEPSRADVQVPPTGTVTVDPTDPAERAEASADASDAARAKRSADVTRSEDTGP